MVVHDEEVVVPLFFGLVLLKLLLVIVPGIPDLASGVAEFRPPCFERDGIDDHFDLLHQRIQNVFIGLAQELLGLSVAASAAATWLDLFDQLDLQLENIDDKSGDFQINPGTSFHLN